MMQPAAVSSVGLVALAGARHTDWAEAAVTKRRPCPVKKGGEKEEGRRREGGGRGRRGPGAQLAPPARQSRGCRERSARRPGPGHRTPYRTRPSLELGQPPTTDTARALPPTGLDTTTDTTSQLRTLLLAPFPRPWTLSPPSAGAQTLSPQQALAIVLLHPSTGHGFLPAPYSPLLAPHLYPVRVRAPLVSPIPRCSGDAARAPIPRLLARMPLPGGLWWLLCCRRGFTLLHRDYGDGELSGDGDEDDETFELRTPSPAGGRRGSLDVTLTQPTRSGPVSDRLQSWEETWSLIPDKGLPEDDPDVVVKGWLYREPRGGGARPWLLPRRAWFVLTRDSLDQFSGSGKGARRLGSLVLTSLCSVTGPERRPKETGLWSVTVSGRKHSIRLCSPRQAEAERWGVALREVIASKAPLETPTQLLLRDIQESCGDPEAVALIYRRNPILRHTSSALYAPLLPLPYGVSAPGPGYAPLREEAVRLFLALQALEGARRPGPLMQGVLQTCRDLPALQDELFLQLAKQTSGPAGPPGLPATQDPATLRYWQLLTCMSCTFRPGGAVRGHLLGHLERTEQALPDSELAEYARFIRKALGRTRGRELVPSLAEISALSRRQELLCTVHCPGAGACPVAIDSHTTAGEVARELVGRLGLARSRNAFALYEQRGAQERALAGGTLVADVLTSLTSEEAGLEDSPDSGWRLCLRLHGPLHPEGLSPDGHELPFLFEQAHALLLRGRPPPPDDTLRALAALRLQSLHRDFSPRGPLPRLDRLLPPPTPPREQPLRPTPRPQPSAALLAGALWSPGLAKRRAERARHGCTGCSTGSTAQVGGGGASSTAAVLGGWKRLRGMGQAEAMAAYLALAAQCPGFGAARYDVLELSTEPGGGAPQKLCLGLGAKAMSLCRPGETEPIHSVSYGHVAACQLIGPHTLSLRVGDSQLLLQSPQVEEIFQLVNAYLANPSPERPCSSPAPPPCRDLPDTSPPSQQQGLEEPQGQSGCLGQLQD